MKSVCLVKTNFTSRYEDSHDFIDIKFWVKYFEKKHNYNFFVYCQKFKSFKNNKNFLFFDSKESSSVFSKLSAELSRILSIPKFDIYIFQAYTEINILIWLIFNFFKKKKIFLIATNNITEIRMNRMLNRFIYQVLRKFKATIFVHSRSEKDIMSKFYPNNLIKIKKYHMWSEVLNLTKTKKNSTNNIFYPGPVKKDKPVKYFNSLYNSNINFFKSFKFILSNIKPELFDVDFKNKTEISNLNYSKISDYLNKSEYMFLPHSYRFEGKLSGNLIDAIDFGIIIISNKINPVIEYFEDYGQLGLLIDFNKITEFEISKELNRLNKEEIKRNLFKARLDHTMDNIFKQLDEVF